MKFLALVLLLWSSSVVAGVTCKGDDSIEEPLSSVLNPVEMPAKIKVFTDFTCRFCKQGSLTMDSLKMKYGDSIRIEPVAYPLTRSGTAVEAAQLFEAFKVIAPEKALDYARSLHNLKSKTRADFIKAAKYLGVEEKKLLRLSTSDQVSLILESNRILAQKENIRGVPGYLINNSRAITGARPISYFESLFGPPESNEGC